MALVGVGSAEEVVAMLERLDEIPWGELDAAYGPAEWVPEAVPCLLDPDPDVRDEALSWIEGGTFHQQTADEATATGLAPDRTERDRAIALMRSGRSDRHSDVRNATDRALRDLEKTRDDSGAGGPSP